jgi:hypothetical protein
MAGNADELRTRELLAQHGTFARKARHGDIWHLPGGATVMCLPNNARGGSTDWRTWRNTLAEVCRALRTAGVPLDDKEEAAVAAKTSTTAAVVKLETAVEEPTDSERAALGIYIARKRLVTEEVEATVDIHTIARLLGLLAASVPRDPDVVVIGMRDLNGHEVEGPVVIYVTRRTREEGAA